MGRLREPGAGADQPVVGLATPADLAVGASLGDDLAGLDRGAVGVSVLAQLLHHPRGPADDGAGGPNRGADGPRSVGPAADPRSTTGQRR